MTPDIIPHADSSPIEQKAFGGGLEGAESLSRETMKWTPQMRSPDQIINAVKPVADARSREMIQNDGYTSGATSLHMDNIVGSQYLLNAQPAYEMLGVDAEWAEEFQRVVEQRFNVIGDSEENWLDASRKNTLTGLIRLGIASFVCTGEILGTAEWIRDSRRPFRTAVQLVSPDRLSNPNGESDSRYLRRGIRRNFYGEAVRYCIRRAHPSETDSVENYQWAEIDARKPWGRKQVIHIIEQRLPDQSRGVSDMVAVLKQMKMTKQFQEITLQNAVINASYAAAIESELPSAEVFAAIGAGATDPMAGLNSYLQYYMGALGSYLDEAKNISVDGAKIPHLFPGTKLNMMPIGQPGGVGSSFEESLLRYIAAGLGLSYEQFSRDYTKTNYSSARASMNETWKFMQSRKKNVADRLATNIYTLWLEEEIAAGNVPLPKGKGRNWFYEPLVKDALTVCTWIGASRGQIDETKETQAAILRIENNLSTVEEECARLGKDFRRVFEQRAREKKLMIKHGLESSGDITKKKAGSKNDRGDKSNDDDKVSEKKANKQTLDLTLHVNHAPIEMKQEPVQVTINQEPMQFTVAHEPIQVQIEQPEVHVHQPEASRGVRRAMNRIPVRDEQGAIIAVREVPSDTVMIEGERVKHVPVKDEAGLIVEVQEVPDED